jgi:UDP-N-acetylmuramate: L-alanyl-gamma-D-glutamyl-meso-diaminopimelate ligase
MLNPALNFPPQDVTTIHIMGICGTGMAALAGMLKHSGYVITGSDNHVYPPMSDFLDRIGITIFNGYKAENLDHQPDLVIVGNVITRKNPEAMALAEAGLPYLSFPQALARFYIDNHHSLVVTGTHGKTTTCSILASSLYHAGLDPSFMIGGIVQEFNSNNRIGQGPYFVSEGDEYDTAFFDKGSKFLHYLPQTAIITSIEFDHADIFDNLDQIKASFAKFIQLMPEDGLIIAHMDDPHVSELIEQASCRVEGYGFGIQNDWIIKKIQSLGKHTHFEVDYKGESHTLTIPLTGKHNCLNSLAVTAVLNSLGQSIEDIQKYLLKFGGVKRRQEIRGVVNNITVIDDFAHHPTAVKETLSGLKSAHPDNRLIVVFEPRTNSSRRSVFQKAYTEAFGDADKLLLREPVPLDNISASDHFSSAQLAEDLRANKAEAWSFKSSEDILDQLRKILEPGDIVAILSNGGFDNIHERLLDMLRSDDK